jgi:predicted TIM-barrel fold metal-dependent hydrolase
MLVDAHIHLGLGGFAADAFAARLERGLTDQFWVSALQGGYYPTPDDVRASNSAVADLMARLPEHVVGFAYVNPIHGSLGLRELHRCIEDLGFGGIKLWVSTLCDDKRVHPVVECAVEYDVPILVHCWKKITGNLPFESTPMHLGKLAKRYPEAKLIMAHLGGDWEYGYKVARECPNIYVDTSGSIAEMDSIERLVQAVGTERVLFGTDNADLSFCRGKILGANLRQEQQEAIFWRNAEKLIAQRAANP